MKTVETAVHTTERRTDSRITKIALTGLYAA